MRPSMLLRAPATSPLLKPQGVHIMGITPEKVAKWSPSLMIWGLAGAGAVTLYLSRIPRFQKDVLHKVPVINTYFMDNTPDEDKPF